MGAISRSRIRARIDALNIAGDVRRIRLTLDDPFRFYAGQYLFVVHPSGPRIPFSIASGPHRLPELELHFRPIAGNDDAVLVNELLIPRSMLILDGPHGDVHVATSTTRPLWLIAGGTGVSQALAIASFLATCAQRAPVRLVWSVTHRTDLYCEGDLRALEKRHWFRCTPVIDVPGDSTNAAVRFIDRHRDEIPDDARILICGGPGFVRSVADALAARGIARPRLESDMFSYGT